MGNNYQYLYDEIGFNSLLKNIEELEEKRKKILAGRSEACQASTGQIADSPEKELNDMELRLVDTQLYLLYEKRNNAEIMSPENPKYRNLNKVIVSDFVLPEGDIEEFIFRIVTATSKMPNLRDKVVEVSLKSPVGRATVAREVGDECHYSVGDENYSIIIKGIYESELFEEMNNSKNR